MLPVSNVSINWVPGITLEEMEKHCILQAFRFYRGNKTQTSQALGIAIRTLDNKLEKYEDDQRRTEERATADRATREANLARMRGLPQPIATAVITNSSSKETGTDKSTGVETSTGVHMESPHKTTPQQAVSVPEREKIQTVLPRQTASHSHRKSR